MEKHYQVNGAKNMIYPTTIKDKQNGTRYYTTHFPDFDRPQFFNKDARIMLKWTRYLMVSICILVINSFLYYLIKKY